MLEAIQDGFKRYSDTSGRSTRPQFWYFALFYIIVNFLSSIIFSDVIDLIVSIAIFIPYLTAAIRRMHDVGRSGWFVIVPIANLVFLVSATKNT
ncbi:MAG: hypothetical protein HW379_684 [Actinobacteria bacterium]|jgi:uncharacterized membrane protein YhaH (DUF805 family)|nr:hypothetical protein [Actinomycetota bacterium]